MKKMSWMGVLVVLALAGCVHSSGKPNVTKSMGPASLALVPADTPYVFATLEALDSKLTDKFLGYAAKYLETVEKKGPDALGQDFAGSPVGRVFMAVMGELHGKLNAAGMKQLGFTNRPRMLIYGLSVFPVMRVEIGDAKTLRATIDRVMAKAGVTAPEKNLGGQAYWSVEEHDVGVVIALVGNEAVFGMFPAASFQAALPYVFGQQKPARSLREAGTLAEVAQAHGLDPRFVGYADLQAVASLLLGETPSIVALPASTVSEMAAVPASCKQEAHRLIALAPRITAGYDRIDEHHLSMKLSLETIPAISEALAALSRPVPGLTLTPSTPLLGSFGAGIDVNGAIALGRKAANAILQEPFQCPALAHLNDSARELEQALAQPLPPFVTGLTGFMVELDELDPHAAPMKVRGGAILVGSGVGDLVKMALGMIGAGSVKVAADGRPVALPLAALGIPGIDQAYLGMKADRAAVAVGAGASERVVALLGAKAPASAPLVLFGMDLGKIMKMSAEVAEDLEKEGMLSIMSVYGFAAYGLEADAKEGVTLHLSMELH